MILRAIPAFLRAVMFIGLLPLGLLSAESKAGTRVLALEDFDRLVSVEDPVCSQDGRSIVYTVDGADLDTDERNGVLWMADYAGTRDVRLTSPGETASKPKFSPDGRYISYLSERDADGHRQIYLLDRQGGAPQALTRGPGDIEGYDWSPDGTRIVFAMTPDEDASEGAAAHPSKTPKPIVIDRLHFKEDTVGYLTAASRAQLYLVTVADRKVVPLTTDARVHDSVPVWSPDGRSIAYFSNHGSDPDRTGMQELYLIEPHAGAVPRKLAEFYAPNKLDLLFTRDGRRILFTTGLEPKLNAYIQDHYTVLNLGDGKTRVLAESVDRAFSSAAVLDDQTIAAILEDDGTEVPVTVRLDSDRLERRLTDKVSVTGLCAGGGHIAVVSATDTTVAELHALEGARLRRLSAHNDAVMNELSLGAVEDISFSSSDGAQVHGMLVKPVGYVAGRSYPTIVWIHGGPNGQDSHGLSASTYAPTMERQWFAAHGYAVLAVNYRGSSGRGALYARAIAADWGDKEVLDLLAGVDYAVRTRIADPQRLGIGGWSYGGILTDYSIAHDGRFKAAVSGAGSGNQISMYGSDQYILQYNAELGAPWSTTDLWVKVSYPFFHADRIHTPTLFLGGEKDFNVPIAGGEQMYAALRTLGVPTQLIIYPGQYHVFTRPSYIKDRERRFLEWYDRYLKAPATP